jgi:hypothetical protein
MMPGGSGLTERWWTECYISTACTVSRPGASGPHGGPIWVVVRNREAPEWWFDDGNDFGEMRGGGSSRVTPGFKVKLNDHSMCAQESSLHTYRTENGYRIINVTNI